MIEYDIRKIAEECKECCNNKFYFVALSGALTLPDICSKIEMQCTDRKKEKGINEYIRWCNEWISRFLPQVSSWACYEGSWGHIIYKLRCGILHDGNIEVCGKPYIFFDLEDFIFSIGGTNDLKISMENKSGDAGHSSKAKINIDIRYLIYAITEAAEIFVEFYDIEEKGLWKIDEDKL